MLPYCTVDYQLDTLRNLGVISGKEWGDAKEIIGKVLYTELCVEPNGGLSFIEFHLSAIIVLASKPNKSMQDLERLEHYKKEGILSMIEDNIAYQRKLNDARAKEKAKAEEANKGFFTKVNEFLNKKVA